MPTSFLYKSMGLISSQFLIPSSLKLLQYIANLFFVMKIHAHWLCYGSHFNMVFMHYYSLFLNHSMGYLPTILLHQLTKISWWVNNPLHNHSYIDNIKVITWLFSQHTDPLTYSIGSIPIHNILIYIHRIHISLWAFIETFSII